MATQEHRTEQTAHAFPAQRETEPSGHAHPTRRMPTRRGAGPAQAPLHAGAPGRLASPAGVRGRPRTRSRREPAVLGAAAVALAAVALVGGQQLAQDEPAPAAGPRADPSLVQAATGSGRTPASARAALEQLSAGRAVITTRLLRATISGDAAMASAAQTVLGSTTEDIATVTRVWQGATVADELAAVLDAQSTASVAYAQALLDGDEAGASRSLVELARSSADLGTWLDQTTGGDVKGLYPREDGGMLRAYAEAELRGDRGAASEYEQLLQLRMSREGGTFATTVAGRAPVASFEERQVVEPWRLLFGRHGVLAGEVVRAEIASADDADDASAALDANTRRLTALVGEALPADRERTFSELWEEHADAVVDHARAAADADAEDRSAAATRLTDTAQALGAFLGEDVAGQALEQHAVSLERQADAWASGESAVTAYTLVINDHATLATLGARTADALGAADADS